MKRPKILLVDDAPEVQLLVKSALGRKYDLTCVTSAEEARQLLASASFALLLLDVSLPGEDGFQLCANLRAEEKHRTLPIIFLTGKNQSRDEVMGFSLGADDYIVKPLDLPKFQARIDAKLRRLQDDEDSKSLFLRGPFRVSLNEQRIFVEENHQQRDLLLSTIEFKLLYFFLRREEHVLSREQILSEVWGSGTHVSDRVVDNVVYTLRTKLGTYADFIQAVPKIGYRMSLSEKAATG